MERDYHSLGEPRSRGKEIFTEIEKDWPTNLNSKYQMNTERPLESSCLKSRIFCFRVDSHVIKIVTWVNSSPHLCSSLSCCKIILQCSFFYNQTVHESNDGGLWCLSHTHTHQLVSGTWTGISYSFTGWTHSPHLEQKHVCGQWNRLMFHRHVD